MVDLFFFHFANAYDLDCIFGEQPWNIHGAVLLLHPWQPNIVLHSLTFPYMDLWVQAYHIPMDCFYLELAEQLAQATGQLLQIDWPEERQINMDYFRFKVRVFYDEPLIPGAYLDLPEDVLHWVQFRYERVFRICYRCERIGHSNTSCRKSLLSVVQSLDRRYALSPFSNTHSLLLEAGMPMFSATMQASSNTNCNRTTGIWAKLLLTQNLEATHLHHYHIQLLARLQIIFSAKDSLLKQVLPRLHNATCVIPPFVTAKESAESSHVPSCMTMSEPPLTILPALINNTQPFSSSDLCPTETSLLLGPSLFNPSSTPTNLTEAQPLVLMGPNVSAQTFEYLGQTHSNQLSLVILPSVSVVTGVFHCIAPEFIASFASEGEDKPQSLPIDEPTLQPILAPTPLQSSSIAPSSSMVTPKKRSPELEPELSSFAKDVFSSLLKSKEFLSYSSSSSSSSSSRILNIQSSSTLDSSSNSSPFYLFNPSQDSCDCNPLPVDLLCSHVGNSSPSGMAALLNNTRVGSLFKSLHMNAHDAPVASVLSTLKWAKDNNYYHVNVFTDAKFLFEQLKGTKDIEASLAPWIFYICFIAQHLHSCKISLACTNYLNSARRLVRFAAFSRIPAYKDAHFPFDNG
ncbi:Uncharacterized protein LOK49_LG04G01233 [Camellia lanceoleosa]|uniref:Uncharacterized protein n=1 Tax=Camellia lanceoleosa TaxID=1840588 RepID=A0ACC0I0K5_9ERIC|nr:Uncharacterized protein LOK49_LG04G01233 [Camellia lanceoleosa]